MTAMVQIARSNGIGFKISDRFETSYLSPSLLRLESIEVNVSTIQCVLCVCFRLIWDPRRDTSFGWFPFERRGA